MSEETFIMKTSLLILAMLASTGANDVQEFSEDVIVSRPLWDPRSSDLSAIFINWNIDLEVVVPPFDEGNNHFSLDTRSIPNQELAIDDPVCDQYHGITIDGDKTFCRILYFQFFVQYQDDPDTATLIHIGIYTAARPETEKTLLLIGHVFKIPSAYASRNTTHQQLSDWARTARVGISYPATAIQLENIIQTHKLTINFEWLKEVLEYGVLPAARNSEPGPGYPEDVYYFRPVVFPDVIVDKILEVDDYLRTFFKIRTNGSLPNGSLPNGNGHVEPSYTAD